MMVTLQRHVRHLHIADKACGIISNLVSEYEPMLKLSAVGGCETITSLLQMHIANVSIVKFSFASILHLSLLHANCSRFLAAGACEAIPAALQSHKSDANLVKRACGAAFGLARNYACQQRLLSCNMLTIAQEVASNKDLSVAHGHARALSKQLKRSYLTLLVDQLQSQIQCNYIP